MPDIIFWYFSLLTTAYLTTFVLIVTGRSWGVLPWAYLRIVAAIQNLFPTTYARSAEAFCSQSQWPQLINKPWWSRLTRTKPDQPPTFTFLSHAEKHAEEEELDLFDATAALAGTGLSSIVQDDFSAAFTSAPSFVESLNGLRAHPDWPRHLKAIFYITLAFRLSILFPIRVALFLTSFLWLTVWAIYASFYHLKSRRKMWIAVCYSRFFSAAMGVIADYGDRKHRPHTKGFAVSSHLSPNDAQILTADMEQDDCAPYIVTGQKHKGIIGVMERFAARIIPTLWLDRASEKERKEFGEEVIKTANTSPSPVMFFPEGYCSNNTQLLQFRRSIFVRDVFIHPIAIRQSARFGDGYWSEDLFAHYLLRLLMSWGVVYKVTYLPKTQRVEGETASEFAARVHGEIARASHCAPACLDGSFFYKKTEQQRVRGYQQESLGALLKTHYDTPTKIHYHAKLIGVERTRLSSEDSLLQSSSDASLGSSLSDGFSSLGSSSSSSSVDVVALRAAPPIDGPPSGLEPSVVRELTGSASTANDDEESPESVFLQMTSRP